MGKLFPEGSIQDACAGIVVVLLIAVLVVVLP